MQADLDRQQSLLREVQQIILEEIDPKRATQYRRSSEPPWPELLTYERLQERLREYKAEKERLGVLATRLRTMGADTSEI